jgi:PleD family two-component response regulator
MTENKHVLVVEDEGIIAMHIANTLTSFGYTVSQASSAEEAIQKAGDQRPDLALLDIMLAGSKDGVWTAEELSNRFGVPIVYLTGHADEKTVERAKATQPLGYILKPFHERQLATTVELAIQRHQQEATASSPRLPLFEVLETLSEAVVLVDGQGRVQAINAAAARLLGCSAAAAVGEEVTRLPGWQVHAQAEQVHHAVTEALRTDTVSGLSGLILRPEDGGGAVYRGDRVVPLHDEQHQIAGAAVILHVVTTHPPDRRPAIARKGEAALDTVTGLPSRAEAEGFVTEAARQGRPMFVAPFKVERFGFLREHFGRSLAETVLQYYGVYLSQEIASGDHLFRWTGPCFVIVMEDRTSLQDAVKSVARFASVRLEQLFDVQERSAVLVISAGWTVIPVAPGETGATMAVKIDEFLLARPE